MSNVGVVIWLRAGLADILHDLVLPFSWDIVAGEDHLAFPPIRVLADLLVHEILELFGEFGHEHGACWNQNRRQAKRECAHTGSDTVAIERLFFRKFLPFPLSLLPDLPRFLGCSEPSAPLLVHLRTRSNSVYSHEKQFLRLYLSK